MLSDLVWDHIDTVQYAYQIHANICDIYYFKRIWHILNYPVGLNCALNIRSMTHMDMIYKRNYRENFMKL